jgi:hypothetical protein
MTNHRPSREQLLAKMASDPNVPQVTGDIRDRAHAKSLDAALDRIAQLHAECPAEDVERLATEQCRILYDDYPRFFTKAIKHPEEIDTLRSMVTVIRQIETGELDQHSGSVVIGTMLKERFVDATTLADGRPVPKLSYAEWKRSIGN